MQDWPVDECPKPVIGRIQGAALGGACGLVACCDIAIAAEEAQFGLSEVRLGIIPAMIGTFVLDAIGPRQVRRYFLTGERFAAAQARELGLVHEVVKAEALDAKVDEIAGFLHQSGPRAVVAAKEVVREIRARPREVAVAHAVRAIARRHVEVQILGDGRDAVALGERECSLQRRYQKVVEEAPSRAISEATRRGLFDSAERLARAVGYANAGTVEFLVGPDGSHYFLEVNTRLQVEHPVTEMLVGIDLVRLQVEIAHGAPLPARVPPAGHAIEARLNAEDPYAGFLPQAGTVLLLEWPQRPGVRVDAGIRSGSEVSTHYESLLAKLIARGPDREAARRRLIEALRETTLLGIVTNQAFLAQVLESDFFVRGETFTTTLETHQWPEPEVPPLVQAAARRALTLRAEEPAGDGGGAADRFAPWSALGKFRMNT